MERVWMLFALVLFVSGSYFVNVKTRCLLFFFFDVICHTLLVGHAEGIDHGRFCLARFSPRPLARLPRKKG